jgi:methylated-DNA-[protein]-cysteine S-methyltransferase
MRDVTSPSDVTSPGGITGPGGVTSPGGGSSPGDAASSGDAVGGIRFLPPASGGKRYFTVVGSPLGELVLVGDGAALVAVELLGDAPGARECVDPAWVDDPAPLGDAAAQLAEYFAGSRTTFELAVAPGGTPFQGQVWRHLAGIAYGTTTTYGEIARALGRPAAYRAVGAANGANPVPIVLPCHRVVAGDGSLIKYGLGGLSRKRLLLDFEAGLRPLEPGQGAAGRCR